jgi:integrase/recombinase XerC
MRICRISSRSFRRSAGASGVQNPPRHLKNGGTLEKAAAMANHASTRTTQLYDRRATSSASMRSSAS